jgi:hypothetical protein
LPKRSGSTPPISTSVPRFASHASCASSSEIATWRARPVARASYSAASVPVAASMPALMSAMATPTFIGSPSGSPVMLMMPPPPWIAKSKPGSSACGESSGYPRIDVYTSDGRSATSASRPSPSFSAPPGRKFSISTSACSASRRTTSWPRGSPRSTATERLPRFAHMKYVDSPPA